MNGIKKSLNQLSNLKKGEQLNRSKLETKGEYPAWNGGRTPSGYTNAWNTPENTITISEGGNSCGFVNYCTEKFWCGGDCYALLHLDNNINMKFLFYYLKAHEKVIMRLRAGSGLPHIQRKDLEKFVIQYPNMKIQQEIVYVLSTARSEIDALKRQKDILKTQKRGLMQKLLTGEWSVELLDQEVP